MIQYNPKEWFTFIFKFHKADTFRQLFPLMFFIAVYCLVIVILEIEYFQLTDTSKLKNISIIHTLLGLALSMLLVFRTNTAYERWWEGRKMWGSLVNSSRNLALKLNAYPINKEDKIFFQLMIINYAYALKNHLRDTFLIDEFSSPQQNQFLLHPQKHVPNQIAAFMFQKVMELKKCQYLSDIDILFLNQELQNFSDVTGACERIKKTPIPFSYSVFIKKFIFFYVMTLPISGVLSLYWLVIPVVVFVFYALASLELIAEEIENPFGTDANDLPAEDICATIKKSVFDIFNTAENYK